MAAWSLAHGGIGWDSRTTRGTLSHRSVDPSWTLARAYATVPASPGVLRRLPPAVRRHAPSRRHRLDDPLQPDDPATYTYQGVANLILAVLAVTAFAAALGARFAIAARRGICLVVDPLDATVARALARRLQGHAGRRGTDPDHGRAHLQLLDPPATGCIRRGHSSAGLGGAIALATRAGSLLSSWSSRSELGGRDFVFGRRRHHRALPPSVAAVTALAARSPSRGRPTRSRASHVQWLRDSTPSSRSFPWVGTIRTAGQGRAEHRHSPGGTCPPGSAPNCRSSRSRPLSAERPSDRRRRSPATERERHGRPWCSCRSRCRRSFSPRDHRQRRGALRRHPPSPLRAPRAPRHSRRSLSRRSSAAANGGRCVPRSPLAAVVVVAASLLASVSWAPYAYAYINPVAGAQQGRPVLGARLLGRQRQGGRRAAARSSATPGFGRPADGVGVPWGAAPRPPAARPTGGSTSSSAGPQRRAADFGCTVVFTIKRGGHVLGEGHAADEARPTEPPEPQSALPRPELRRQIGAAPATGPEGA